MDWIAFRVEITRIVFAKASWRRNDEEKKNVEKEMWNVPANPSLDVVDVPVERVTSLNIF